MELFLGVGQFRHYVLVTQDNLEAVTTDIDKLLPSSLSSSPSLVDIIKHRPDLIIYHRDLAHSFLGFDRASGSYRLTQKQKYCFPTVDNRKNERRREEIFQDNNNNNPSQAITTSLETDDFSSSVATAVNYNDSTVSIRCDTTTITTEEETAAYHATDALLVDLLCTMRTSFSQTRKNDAKYRQQQLQQDGSKIDEDSSDDNSRKLPVLDMNELMDLLKNANSREHSHYVENLLWLIWLSHDEADINRLMRLSIAHSQRGNMEQAVVTATKAIDLDSDFAESYNKCASYHYAMKRYDKCIVSGKNAVQRFPNHIGALAGLGLSYDRIGKRK